MIDNREVHLLSDVTSDQVVVSRQSFSLIIDLKKKIARKKLNPMLDRLNQTEKMNKASGDIFN